MFLPLLPVLVSSNKSTQQLNSTTDNSSQHLHILTHNQIKLPIYCFIRSSHKFQVKVIYGFYIHTKNKKLHIEVIEIYKRICSHIILMGSIICTWWNNLALLELQIALVSIISTWWNFLPLQKLQTTLGLSFTGLWNISNKCSFEFLEYHSHTYLKP